jgi:hypothetical protein
MDAAGGGQEEEEAAAAAAAKEGRMEDVETELAIGIIGSRRLTESPALRLHRQPAGSYRRSSA